MVQHCWAGVDKGGAGGREGKWGRGGLSRSTKPLAGGFPSDDDVRDATPSSASAAPIDPLTRLQVDFDKCNAVNDGCAAANGAGTGEIEARRDSSASGCDGFFRDQSMLSLFSGFPSHFTALTIQF